MSVEIDVQLAVSADDAEECAPPRPEDVKRWVRAALAGLRSDAEVVIRIVGQVEAADLNLRYRDRHGPTNVLSFPFGDAAVPGCRPLGDVVICAPLVCREARAQGKTPEAHWAHLVVHGVLHLLGYEHERDEEAGVMEAEETKVLAGLGFPEPYEPRDAAAGSRLR